MKCPKCGSNMRKFKIGTGLICPKCRYSGIREDLEKERIEKIDNEVKPILRFNRIDKIIVNKAGFNFYTRNQLEKPYVDLWSWN
jgi:uncharacterized Zn finger protein (UPF0148 family)